MDRTLEYLGTTAANWKPDGGKSRKVVEVELDHDDFECTMFLLLDPAQARAMIKSLNKAIREVEKGESQ